MKITFLEFTGRGGIFQYTNAYAKELVRTGIESEIITSPGYEKLTEPGRVIPIEPYSGLKKGLFLLKRKLSSPNPSKAVSQESGMSAGPSNMNSPLGCRHLWEKIYRRVSNDNTEILHIQWIWDHYDFQIEYMQKIIDEDMRIFFTFHNSIPHDGINEELRTFYSQLPRVVSCFFCHSEYDKDVINREYGIEKEKITVMPMGNVMPIEPRKKHIDKHIPTFLFFGHIRPYKGLIPFLERLSAPEFKGLDFNLKIAGTVHPSMKGELSDILDAHPFRDSIELIDTYLEEKQIVSLFSKSDYLVLPYTSATQSAVIPLSYALSTPVIVSTVGGLKELVDNNNTGFVSEDPAETIREIILTPESDDLALSMGEKSREYYLEHLTWANIIREYKKLI